jgi:hypothetical protein
MATEEVKETFNRKVFTLGLWILTIATAIQLLINSVYIKRTSLTYQSDKNIVYTDPIISSNVIGGIGVAIWSIIILYYMKEKFYSVEVDVGMFVLAVFMLISSSILLGSTESIKDGSGGPISAMCLSVGTILLILCTIYLFLIWIGQNVSITINKLDWVKDITDAKKEKKAKTEKKEIK